MSYLRIFHIELDEDTIPVIVGGGLPMPKDATQCIHGMFIGVPIGNERVQKALRDRDERLFIALLRLMHDWEDVDDATDTSWLDYEYRKNGGLLLPEAYRQRISRFLSNPYASAEDKCLARKVLAGIDRDERSQKQSSVKRRVIQRRRSQYAARRDELMLALIERDGYECSFCGSQDGLTIDHIMPLSRGGSDQLNNLQILCQSCNSQKKDRMPDDEA